MVKIFYVLITDEYNFALKKWVRHKYIYNSLDSLILFKNFLLDRRYAVVKRVEELIMWTYSTGYVEFI